MMSLSPTPLLCCLILLLGACASKRETSFYTLLRPLDAAGAAALAGASGGIEVLPVSVPAQVDVPALVVRQGGARLQPVDDRHWIAPLADEIRAALTAALRLHGAAAGEPWKLQVDVTRFESALGQYALLEADWALLRSHAAQLRCHSLLVENAGEGYEALVAAHQRAVERLAGQVALAVRAGSACP